MIKSHVWHGLNVLVTGHTGFKGTWLCAWLSRLGARVSGFALPADANASPYDLICPSLVAERLGDIRDRSRFDEFVNAVAPDVIIHLAAQPLVRISYEEPVETYATNVMGTINVLEAARRTPSVRAVLVVTTDKVYENNEAGRPFTEHDRLGGHDPYSASKACTEIVAASYRRSFFSPSHGAVIATARSGNVIGGGDWSADRIVPDVLRAIRDGSAVRLRYPHSVRPWLHLLEPLAGYLIMTEAMLTDRAFSSESLNFAPDPAAMRTVAQLVERFAQEFGGRPTWIRENGAFPREAELLTLDASAARRQLGWETRLDFDAAIGWTADWYRLQMSGGDARSLTFDQIDRYMDMLSATDQESPGARAEPVAG